jgi:nitrous oxidase accessory protein NosD
MEKRRICFTFREVFRIITLVILIAESASAATLTVDDSGGAMYTKIQEAVNAASPGDTIYVNDGTYKENIVIPKSLTLNGQNMSNVIIDGGKSGHGI